MAEVVLEGVSNALARRASLRSFAHYRRRRIRGVAWADGAGKTTTLRLVAGLERPDAGRISIAGHDGTSASPAQRDVAFVFQQYSLYPHLSVFDNLAFPLRSPARRSPEPRIRQRVNQVASLLRISDKLEERVTRLSGSGQMQRVAIGRALVRSPSIYLMDEPLSSLDAKLRTEFCIELKRIQTELGATILYVTHDQTEAMTLGTRVGVIENGRLVQVGTPRQVYEDPLNVYVAARLGSPSINLAPRSLFPDIAMPEAQRRSAFAPSTPTSAKPTASAPPAASNGSSILAIRIICMSISASVISLPWRIPISGSGRATK